MIRVEEVDSERETPEHRWIKTCPACRGKMIFYPGCCGNLPLWRCEKCGTLLKWTEEITDSDRYLQLK